MSGGDPASTANLGRRVRRGLALRPKFVLAISALVALVLATQAAVQAVAGRRALKHDIEEHALSFGTLVVRPLCEAYETYYASGYGTFRRLVGELLRLEPDIARLALYDTSGRLLFDSREFDDPLFDPASRDRAPIEVDAMLLAGLRGLQTASLRDAEGRLQLIVPYVEDWGRHRYTATLDVSYVTLREETRAAAWRILLVSVAALGLGVLIAALLARQSLGPLEVLTAGAQDLADGQLQRRIDLTTGDEFEQLAGTFNLMAARLQRTVSDLESSNRELAELDRMKSDLLANVSHELRTPLTAIQGYAEAMGDGLLGSVGDAQREALAVIGRNVTRLRGMIDQLLAYARLDAGAVTLDLEEVDAVAVAEQAVGTVRAIAPGGLALRVDAEPGLPPVFTDASRFAQVLDNLLTNAVKFTPSGEVVVELRVVQSGEAVEIAVRDTGIGIPASARDRIFDRFFQVDTSSTRRYGGMGLGLSIVREILAAQGVTINVESEAGRGSTFRFRLPVPVAAPASEAVAGERGRAGAGAAGRRRLVLIDDDPVFLQTVSGLLGRCGYEVATAGSLASGRALVERTHPDLVLLDRLLPDGDGIELLSALAADPATRDIPVLLVSIRDEPASGLARGAAGYLVKPIEPAALRQAIASALPRHRLDAARAAGRVPLVLVVDDEPDLRRLLRERLEADGLRVAEAADGRQALDLLQDSKVELPELVILDLMMPALNGWELLQRLRRNPRTAAVPVIVLTARDTPQDRALGRALAVVDYVHKPFDLNALVAEIEQTLAHPSAGAAPPARSEPVQRA